MENTQFPSPCGDMVLKLSVEMRNSDHQEDVSVPLRGYGFEITEVAILLDDAVNKVSVPLRGYGFEIIKGSA